MAEALTRHFGGTSVQAVSAGLRPGARLAAGAEGALRDIGVGLPDHAPQPMEAVREPVDIVISLCDVIAPGLDLFPGARRLRWRVPDPIMGKADDYRRTRDLIWSHLRPLLAELSGRTDLPDTLTSSCFSKAPPEAGTARGQDEDSE